MPAIEQRHHYTPASHQATESALHQALKRETRALHKRLEAELGLLEPALTIGRYRQVLRAFHGWYSPVEPALVRLADAAGPLGFPLRARTKLIASDLVALGLSEREVAELPRCTQLPRLACIEDLAGCLYVLEGACLGGQVIVRALRRRLRLGRHDGLSFFTGDAEATSARWILVLQWLASVERTGARSEEIVATAGATFESLARWVEQHGAS